jgi:phage baseplate assembly protein W
MAKKLSLEDKDLGVLPQITLRTSSYSDVDLSFTKRKNAAAVKQAIKNLIMTNHYEKPFNLFYGGNVTRLLFDLADDLHSEDVETQIREAIENYEPRVRILDISAKILGTYNTCSVIVTFQVITTNEIVTLETDIARLR